MLFTRTFAFALLCLAVTVPAAPTDPSVIVARESPSDLQRKLYSSTTNTNRLGAFSVRARTIGMLSANRCNFDLFFTFTFVDARESPWATRDIDLGLEARELHIRSTVVWKTASMLNPSGNGAKAQQARTLRAQYEHFIRDWADRKGGASAKVIIQ
jgi:hypothetical protein